MLLQLGDSDLDSEFQNANIFEYTIQYLRIFESRNCSFTLSVFIIFLDSAIVLNFPHNNCVLHCQTSIRISFPRHQAKMLTRKFSCACIMQVLAFAMCIWHGSASRTCENEYLHRRTWKCSVILVNIVLPLHAGIIAISAGYDEPVFLKKDGTVWLRERKYLWSKNKATQLTISGMSSRLLERWTDAPTLMVDRWMDWFMNGRGDRYIVLRGLQEGLCDSPEFSFHTSRCRERIICTHSSIRRGICGIAPSLTLPHTRKRVSYAQMSKLSQRVTYRQYKWWRAMVPCGPGEKETT